MKAELLAPAGSYDSMRAAYEAGADAVYIGGSRFGARAYADNPDEQKLLEAIDYAHLKGKKLYLTVNTLVKEEELDQFYAYLKPYYEEGLDAVIVQDPGVLQLIRREFPGMDIHASTQMTVTGVYGAKCLKEQGVSRIVTARELSLAEISRIHEQVDVEIESFVHGALCYCYSGQCLFSSMIGERSGNRGRCAQPCRLSYQLLDREKAVNKEKNRYLLSPKDICTLEILPKVLNSGVYSLKIEGRMKRPEYTAGVVRIYRKYLDRFLKLGEAGYRVAQEDLTELLDLYNRGGFSKGYYMRHNGPEMMSMERPNHWGTKAAEILEVSKNRTTLRALEPLHEKDVLEYRRNGNEQSITLKAGVKRGERFTVSSFSRVSGLKKNGICYRTRNEELLKKLEETYLNKKSLQNIKGKVVLIEEQPALLTVKSYGVEVRLEGDIVQQAQKRPLTREDVDKQLRKTGDTIFTFDDLQIEMGNSVFLPVQSLKELRRKSLEELQHRILEEFKRKLPDRKTDPVFHTETSYKMESESENKAGRTAPSLSVSVCSAEQFSAAIMRSQVNRIYLEYSFFSDAKDLAGRAGKVIARCRKAGQECIYAMPWIFREKAERYYSDSEVQKALNSFDGILIRSLEEYRFLKEIGYRKNQIADYNLYTWNGEARTFFKKLEMDEDTAPLELTAPELRKRGCKGGELIVYGYLPLMISAQCQVKNHMGCTGKQQTLFLRDRMQKQFPVTNCCNFCYNMIYNSMPLELIKNNEEIVSMEFRGIRLQFTFEDEKQTGEILDDYIRAFEGRDADSTRITEFTRGHFKRRVE